MNKRRHNLALIGATALFFAAGVVFVLVDPFNWRGETVEQRQLQERMAYRKEIAELHYTPIEPAIASEFTETFRRVARDPHDLVAPEQAQALASVVFDQILARSGPDAQAYIDLAESDHTRWIDPDDPENARDWEMIDLRHRSLYDRPAPKDDVKGVLRRFLTYVYENDKSRLTGVNVSDRPPYVHYYRVRTSDDIMRLALKPMNAEEFDDWYNAPVHRGFRFRKPQRPLEDVLRTERIALCAAVFVVVETEAGNQYNWETYWYWDPGNQRWENHEVARRGWYAHVMHF